MGRSLVLIGMMVGLFVAGTAYGEEPFRLFSFNQGSLHGAYVFQVGGFDFNDVDMGGHTGQIDALGLLTFDGQGGVTGTVHFTSADSGKDQAACAATLDAASTYSVDPEGTGTLTLTFLAGGPVTGSLSFQLVMGNALGSGAKLLLANTDVSKVVICGEPLSTLTQSGQLTRQFEF